MEVIEDVVLSFGEIAVHQRIEVAGDADHTGHIANACIEQALTQGILAHAEAYRQVDVQRGVARHHRSTAGTKASRGFGKDHQTLAL